ncbi:MAG TPA: DinB family protein [Chitinophagaceae bacterium]|nr:DinB family protein [Chitinophagaceae bacterium]
MPRPDLTRIPAYFHHYVNQVPEDDLMEAFRQGTGNMMQLLARIPASKHDYRYEPGKWTVREVLQHVIDAERVFAYRALRFARMDTTPLPGFDENLFARHAQADRRRWEDLVNEFQAVRTSSQYLFSSFGEEQLNASGIASNQPVYVLGIGFLLIGHALHHLRIIEERYL